MTGPSATSTVDDGPLFFTLAAASPKCSVSQDVLKDAIKTGRLKAKRTGENGGGLYLVSKPQLQEWFDGLVDA